MAQKSYFFDAVLTGGVYDRAYDSNDFANYFAALVGNGVVYDVSTALKVLTSSGMNVSMQAGAAFLLGRKYENTAALTLAIGTANGALPRVDRIVIKLDKTARTIAAYVLAGTPASTPTAPAITQGVDVFEISVAQVYVGAGVSSITPTDITDERLDTTVCGIVTGLIQQIDAATLFDQLEAQFNLWFASIQGQLSGDPATSLQLQVDALENQIGFSGTTGGTSPNYTITLDDFSLVAGVKLELKFHAGCTSAATLNITSHNTITEANTVLGAKNIVDSYGSSVNYLTANSYVTLIYNGTAFQVIGLATQYARYA